MYHTGTYSATENYVTLLEMNGSREPCDGTDLANKPSYNPCGGITTHADFIYLLIFEKAENELKAKLGAPRIVF